MGLVITGWLLLSLVAPAKENPHVLLLYSNHRLLPANLEFEAGLRETLAVPTELSAEFLDYPRFNGESYIRALTTFLREKYALRPPTVLVVGGEEALEFLLRHRAELLFPRIPVVHAAVAQSFLPSLPPLPADVVGIPIEYDFPGTIDLALRFHPQARQLVIVTGASAQDRAWEAQLRGEVPQFQERVTAEFLAGLPTDVVLKRLSELGGDATVFTPGYFEDGMGRQFSPREATRLIAAAAAPVYGPFDTFMDTGIVGGSMPSFAAMGRQAGRIVNDLLAGVAPAALRLPKSIPKAINVDWRQVRRWDIDPHAIPGDAIVWFKTLSLLEEYPTEIVFATAAFLLQTGLIAGLLLERRRRRRMELAMQQQRFELVHASRLAVAGELTGAIAHEINQPLGAILSNADAADLLLASSADRRDELRSIVADIRHDDLRASEIINRLRALLAKQAVERQPFDLNSAVRDMEPVLRGEARRREIALEVRTTATAALLAGDRVQIQQVLLNLVLNALDVVADLPEERRVVAVSVECDADCLTLVVRDRGHGIAPEHLPKLFDSFFSTKRQGMGLGLSIARTLVEAHGGRIWVESAPGEGAVFRVEWPTTNGTGTPGPA